MKLNCVLLMIYLLSGSVVCAQKGALNKLFDKYENEEDVVVITLSKSMFSLIADKISTNDVNLSRIVPKIESLRMMTSNKNKVKAMAADFKVAIDKEKAYEELMRIKEKNKSNIVFYVKKKGDLIGELIMLILDEQSCVIIQIMGNFALEDIQQLATLSNS